MLFQLVLSLALIAIGITGYAISIGPHPPKKTK
jgi:hypothetical protein